MKNIFLCLVLLLIQSCGIKEDCKDECCKKDEKEGSYSMVSRNSNDPNDVKCKLSSPELQKRKETVLAELKSVIQEQKELFNGYSFKFKGDDATVAKLKEFISFESKCCGFFTFELKKSEDKSNVWLNITGSSKAKKFIKDEMGLTKNSEASQITCPFCGFKKIESMPTDICQLSYTCTKCGKEMHPKNGDCCVFCTYGDHKCPSKQ
jgi:hypothetical protein